jgi:sigma-B regulation protein RsbU (phosphoserine phosphatase)
MTNNKTEKRSQIAPITFTDTLAKTVFNSLSANIAIIDAKGVILETNQAWRNYATANQMEGANDSIGVNYLELCDATTGKEAADARKVSAGIRSVANGDIKEFIYDYPCHGPDGRHFYCVRAVRVAGERPVRVVVSHEDITELILAEEALRKEEKERDRLQHSLELAREVQQILLPRENPKIAGLDLAGKSVYCDETGGDYYDFFQLEENGNEKLGVVVGDAAGHGISAALLMATVRSALRQRLASPGSISQIMADVNHHLAGDLADSGQFATLFFLVLNPTVREVEWVRAGHEPAIFYDSSTNDFIELAGSGMALGVDKDCRYEKNHKSGVQEGSIIVIGTDGVWETRNKNGQMLGRDAICETIRSNSSAAADDILAAIIARNKMFRKGAEPEDDVTLVVLKVI